MYLKINHVPDQRSNFRAFWLMYSILIACFFMKNNTIIAQNCDTTFNHAMLPLCVGDTLEALKRLDGFLAVCMDGPYISSAHYLKAKLYRGLGKLDDALKEIDLSDIYLKRSEVSEDELKKLECSHVNLETLRYESFASIEDTCDWFWRSRKVSTEVTTYILRMERSDLLALKGDHKGVLSVLNNMDRNTIFGYSGGVNGQIAIESRISWLCAKSYLALHDTVSAIERLVDYALFQETAISDSILFTLKKLLYQKYSKATIEFEIQSSIENILFVRRAGAVCYSTEYSLFGRKIPYMGHLSVDALKSELLQNKRLQYLRE